MSRYRAVRGTADLLPGQLEAWNSLEDAARKLAKSFGYSEIRTPLFEEAELFTRGMGVLAGIVERELWTFHDKFGKKLALRADMTTGIVRAFQQHKLGQADGQPVKLFYLAPVFLLGKDSEEGSRQAHQFGVEALGSNNPALDAEMIALASNFCDEIGLEGHTIELNSLGGSKCRPAYEKMLREYFGAHSGELCSTCKRKFKAQPTWVLSCEEKSCTELAQVAPTIYGMLSPDCKSHFSTLKEYLKDLDLSFELNPRVIRDLEYYNRTIFQLRCGSQVVAFGGRYDGLVETLGGKPTPAVGFAINLEAVLELLGDRLETSGPTETTVFLDPEGPESTKVMVPVLARLRKLGIRAEMRYGNGAAAAKKASRIVVRLTEANAFRGHALLEDSEGKNDKLPATKLGDRLVAHLKLKEDSPDRSGRRKLSRKGRKSGRDEEPKPQRSKSDNKPEKQSKPESSERDNKSRTKRIRKRKQSDEEPRRSSSRTKESKPARIEEEKAIVPSLNLGNASPAPAPKPRPKKTEKEPVKAEHVPELSSEGLSWSIMPPPKAKRSEDGDQN